MEMKSLRMIAIRVTLILITMDAPILAKQKISEQLRCLLVQVSNCEEDTFEPDPLDSDIPIPSTRGNPKELMRIFVELLALIGFRRRIQ